MAISYTKIGGLTASKTRRVFKTFEEFEAEMEGITKEATQRTLDTLKEYLRTVIQKNVYDSYNPTWYKDKRTYSLINDATLEAYIYKNVKNQIGGGVRFNSDYYDSHSDRDLFQHGNDIRFLPMGSFLQIMNNSPKSLHDNPYHFPTDIDRGNFWDEFLDYVDKNYRRIFETHFNTLKLVGGYGVGRGSRVKAVAKSPTSNNSMNLSSSTSHLGSVGTHNVNY